MRSFRLSRPVALASIAAIATTLVGGQQILARSTTPEEARVETIETSTPAFRPLEVPTAPLRMAAAVPTGQFEQPFVAVPHTPPATKLAPVSAAPEAPRVAANSEPELEAASVASPKPLLFQTGIASTYGDGDGFEGLRTGCGGIFHTHQVQVAHKTLPCGTVVRVQDTDTGKSVDAEVTDRGPYVDGRIVDLSLAAFTQLDPSGTGLLHVNVYILDTSNQYTYRLR